MEESENLQMKWWLSVMEIHEKVKSNGYRMPFTLAYFMAVQKKEEMDLWFL